MTKHLKLFLIVGQPNNGKTTISKWFKKQPGCVVIHTDQVYRDWIAANHPKHKGRARNIRGHYPTLPAGTRRNFQEHVTEQILAALAQDLNELVVEGWLMLYLPEDLQARIAEHATILRVHMRRYVANVAEQAFKPAGRDYSGVVAALRAFVLGQASTAQEVANGLVSGVHVDTDHPAPKPEEPVGLVDSGPESRAVVVPDHDQGAVGLVACADSDRLSQHQELSRLE
jgi:hypothetical protein